MPFDQFYTEPAFDFLRFGIVDNFGTGWFIWEDNTMALNGNWSGSAVPFWKDMVPRNSDSFQTSHGDLYFDVDPSVQRNGFSISEVTVTCEGNNLLTRTLLPGERYSGVLLGTDDVIYTRIPVTAGDSSANNHITIALWSDDRSGANDFDLYIRCNTYPTPDIHDQVDFRSSADGFLHVNPGQCTSTGYWYVAIHSFRGSGMFNLAWGAHRPSMHRDFDAGMSVGFQFPTVGIDSTADRLRKGARWMYGATEGGAFLANIRLHSTPESVTNSCNCGSPAVKCTTLFDDGMGNGGSSPACRGEFPDCVHVSRDADEVTLAHEWGHYHLCLLDEYVRDSVGVDHVGCGHTLMAANTLPRHPNMCTELNHARDTEPGWTANVPAAWDDLTTRGCTDTAGCPTSPIDNAIGYPTNHTPDLYTFQDFDFNGLVGNVSIVP